MATKIITKQIRMSIDNNNIMNELNQYTINEVIELAEAKVWAKIVMLEIDLKNCKADLASGNYGAITKNEVKLIVECTKKELVIWNYLDGLIAKNWQKININDKL